ncbi:MAG: bifunctional proline dehydrogenase/L-glutamate gamma-semialdehyde dehydrogenase PutA [Candidatus Puniceispirillales bacterium WSBS_2018_MAG_OTU23]
MPHQAADADITLPKIKTPPSESTLLAMFMAGQALGADDQQIVLNEARQMTAAARRDTPLLSAEKLISMYRLSDQEGRMMMELAEALLRIPDQATRDVLIHDKLAAGDWTTDGRDMFVASAGRALMMASGITRSSRRDGALASLSRFGLSPLRRMVTAAMTLLGGQFVYAEDIDEAVKTAAKTSALMSFDMLGEAARSAEDCTRYFQAYHDAITTVGTAATAENIHENNGISIKLSALSCRFQTRFWNKEGKDLGKIALELALLARSYNIPLTIDAEEAGRLAPSLAVFRFLLHHPDLRGWNGLGVVVQAYARHAGAEIDWLMGLAKSAQMPIHIRLVKGAYWDSEIKLAQEKGLGDFPVYTDKNTTDLAYLAHAKTLLAEDRWIYPQFASHNAVTLAAVARLAIMAKNQKFEVQKLHGMGDAIHNELMRRHDIPCRTYAPVGVHKDLLAYLVRRLLENGANSSFMNKLADPDTSIESIITNPYQQAPQVSLIRTGTSLFFGRLNSLGFDEEDPETIADYRLMMAVDNDGIAANNINVENDNIKTAFDKADAANWRYVLPRKRAEVLRKIAAVYEENASVFYHLLAHEAGKTIDDAAGELREASDFCHYYAAQLDGQTDTPVSARGTVVAISPWNFPLAIFTGQVVAALAAGNSVLAKPAEQTPRIACFAAEMMLKAGIPQDALQMFYGTGTAVGGALVAAGRADMVVFTGSTATAKHIERAIANSSKPLAPLLAETGGLNAMIVDSSALLERVVDDVVTSAFRSAGQRCSALRVLYVQDSIADTLKTMIVQAAASLTLGNPTDTAVDIGPLIDAAAGEVIFSHIDRARQEGRLIWQGETPLELGCFCPPTIISIDGIGSLKEEIFGPVLHIATYKSNAKHGTAEIAVVDAINEQGYGLTFGIQSRIDEKISTITAAIKAGNIYVNRNQIGAVVGSQPFGGVGLSGTGPKAGGEYYLAAFTKKADAPPALLGQVQCLPGPDGELNQYKITPRGKVLVIHPDADIAQRLAHIARGAGNAVIISKDIPQQINGVDAVMVASDGGVDGGALRRLMASAAAHVIPIITANDGGGGWLIHEWHYCRDTTASGGNVDLLTS